MPAALGVVIFLVVAIPVLGGGVIVMFGNDLTSNLSGHQSMYDSRVLALEDFLDNRGLDAIDAQPIK